MRGIAAGPGQKFFDIVGQHPLQPGHTLGTRKLHDAEPILLSEGRRPCGGLIIFG